MSAFDFTSLQAHVGHTFECVEYKTDDGEVVNVSLECMDCGAVMVEFDNPAYWGDED
jgi:hypothetical protein